MNECLFYELAGEKKRRPAMTGQDAVKYLYQAAFGVGHLVRDPEAAGLYLARELETMGEGPEEPLMQPIGDRYVRLNLRPAAAAGIRPEWILRMLLLSAKNAEPLPDKASMIEPARNLLAGLGWSAEETEPLLQAVLLNGELPSHSESYRQAYCPAYRVLKQSMMDIVRILCRIAKCGSERILIGMDGCCASGKTTLAALLSEVLQAPVIHMDDFYVPHASKTPERLAQPGGNADTERMKAEVIDPWIAHQPIVYRPYSCSQDCLLESVSVPDSPLTIIEGSYTLHPALKAPYAIRIFLRIPQADQLNRLKKREGDYFPMFPKRWIPLEEAYFKAFSLPDADCMVLHPGTLSEEETAKMTGKKISLTVEGRSVTLLNQRCKEWTYPYAWQGEGNLCDSGCGIFSLCHALQWLTGEEQDPEKWADFSVACGGRGDDGTDRPVLLHGLQVSGEAARHGFYYEEDGLRNDLDVLFDEIYSGRCVAFCNLRVGHIVSLVDARIENGEKQFLAIDSHIESEDPRVHYAVREVIPDSAVSWNAGTAENPAEATGYGVFWVAADQPKDFNLLHRLPKEG